MFAIKLRTELCLQVYLMIKTILKIIMLRHFSHEKDNSDPQTAALDPLLSGTKKE